MAGQKMPGKSLAPNRKREAGALEWWNAGGNNSLRIEGGGSVPIGVAPNCHSIPNLNRRKQRRESIAAKRRTTRKT
jgi:hypothetical protein